MEFIKEFLFGAEWLAHWLILADLAVFIGYYLLSKSLTLTAQRIGAAVNIAIGIAVVAAMDKCMAICVVFGIDILVAMFLLLARMYASPSADAPGAIPTEEEEEPVSAAEEAAPVEEENAVVEEVPVKEDSTIEEETTSAEEDTIVEEESAPAEEPAVAEEPASTEEAVVVEEVVPLATEPVVEEESAPVQEKTYVEEPVAAQEETIVAEEPASVQKEVITEEMPVPIVEPIPEEPIVRTLGESLALAKSENNSSCVDKQMLADYFSNQYPEDMIVNHRPNTIKSGVLPLADTYYTKNQVVDGQTVARKKPLCFVYVFETEEDECKHTLVLLKTSKEHIDALQKDHPSVAASNFPKMTTGQWYSLAIDNTYTSEQVYQAIKDAKCFNDDPNYSLQAQEPVALSLGESLALAKSQSNGSCLTKLDLSNYFATKYAEDWIVNSRPNSIKSGILPLADTYYTKNQVVDGQTVVRKKPLCFVYVFETTENDVPHTLVLLKTSKEHIDALQKDHPSVATSNFPKMATGQWYSLSVDDTYTPEQVYQAIEDAACINNDPHYTLQSYIAPALSLGESLALAKSQNNGSCVNKQSLVDYLSKTYGDGMIVNHRPNTIKSGILPLADTYYTKEQIENGQTITRKKPLCFVYAFENNEDEKTTTLILLKTSEEHATLLHREHASFAPSQFPKMVTGQWYSMSVDETYTPAQIYEAIDEAKRINEDSDYVLGSASSLSLGESLQLAHDVASSDGPCVKKADLVGYLSETYGDEMILNNRPNTIKSGILPLADTYYTKVCVTEGQKSIRKKPLCFVYAFETKTGETLILLKTSSEHVQALKQQHPLVAPSRFPKMATGQWYSLVMDNTYSKKQVFAILDEAKAINEQM